MCLKNYLLLVLFLPSALVCAQSVMTEDKNWSITERESMLLNINDLQTDWGRLELNQFKLIDKMLDMPIKRANTDFQLTIEAEADHLFDQKIKADKQ